MTDPTIPGNELRDQILDRIENPPQLDRDQVLSVPVNRDLFKLIATKHPRSIVELHAVAHHLAPDVSKALAALVRADLIGFERTQTATVPVLTEAGWQAAWKFWRRG